jgi:hypothetical protein
VGHEGLQVDLSRRDQADGHGVTAGLRWIDYQRSSTPQNSKNSGKHTPYLKEPL